VLEENHDAHAYQAARSFKPDLVLLDVIIQGFDGGKVAAQIQADGGLHNPPIIFLTGLVTKAEAKSGLHIDGHPVLAKPTNIPELIETIENVIACEFTTFVGITAPPDHTKREILASRRHRPSQTAAREIAQWILGAPPGESCNPLGIGCFRDCTKAVISSSCPGGIVLPKAGMFTPPFTMRMMMSLLESLSPT
jgi:CheY-like chemotaxis protein